MGDEPQAGAAAEEDAAPPASSRGRIPWIGLLKGAVAVALVMMIVRQGLVDPSALERALTRPLSIAASLGLGAVALALTGLRWAILLRGEGIAVSPGLALRLTWIGHFFNMLFPGAVSGDAVKMYYVGREAPGAREEAWTTVLADRVIGLVALVSLATAASLYSFHFMWSRPELRYALVTMLALLGLSAVVGAGLSLGVGSGSPRLRRGLRRLPFATSLARGYRVFARLARRPGRCAAAFVLSLATHALAVANAWVLGRAAGEETLAFVHYATLFPVALFANAIPISPGGLGVGEKSLGLLFSWSGGAEADGVTVMILFRCMFLALALVGAVLYLLDPGKGREALAPSRGAGAS